MFQYYDGYVFVTFDKQTSCDCSQKSRMAFNVNDPETKFIQSMLLMAYSTGRSVNREKRKAALAAFLIFLNCHINFVKAVSYRRCNRHCLSKSTHCNRSNPNHCNNRYFPLS